jgi:hypothetical protein
VKSIIFWDMTPWSPLSFNRHFGGTCRLHLQDRRINQARNQRESRWQAKLYSDMLSRWFLARLILRPWRWRRHVLPKRRLTFNGLHGVISQKIRFFIPTAVRTSNLKTAIFFLNAINRLVLSVFCEIGIKFLDII